MSSTFYGLEIAKSALFNSRYNMNIAGHNLANGSTPGYSRQRLVGSAVPPGGNSLYGSAARLTQSGGGVKSEYITQIRDIFVDKQFRNECSQDGYSDTIYKEYSWMGSTFINEIEQNKVSSLSASLAKFYEAVDQVGKTPSNLEFRTNLVQMAKGICDTSASYYTKLKDQYDDMNNTVKVQSERINGIASEISKLNGMIFEFELDGAQANDLRDRRNLLLDELSSYTSITYQESDNKNDFTVWIGDGKDPNNMLLKGTGNVRELALHKTMAYKLPDPDGANLPKELYEVYWKDTYVPGPPINHGTKVGFVDGSIQASLDIRDGSAKVRGLPDIVKDLNGLIRKLVQEINEVHEKGYTLPISDGGTPPTYTSKTGQYFFDMAGSQDSSGGTVASKINSVNISNFKVTDNIKNDPRYFAASDKEVDYDEDNPQTGNSEIARKLVELYKQSSTGNSENFDSRLKSIMSNISSAGSKFKENATSQKIRLNQVIEQRMSISSVSSDEEFAEMIKYSKAFNAAARLLTAMDEQLDTLVNKLGLVGR